VSGSTRSNRTSHHQLTERDAYWMRTQDLLSARRSPRMLRTVPRAIYLGLRSNVRFFASRQGFARLSNRIKGLSLLYDTLLFEDGVYEARIGDDAATQFVFPLVSPHQLRPLRNRVGMAFGVRVAETGSDEYHTVLAAKNVQSFRAQFITVADEMTAGQADWFEKGSLLPTYAEQAKDLAHQWDHDEDSLAKKLWPDVHPRLRSIVHENLNLDLASAAVLGMHLAPDALHQPMLHAKAAASQVELHGSGERTLWAVLPNIAEATWEDVASLRKDPGLSDLRAKLAEIDDATLDGEDLYQATFQAALDDAEQRRPRWFVSGLWSVVNLLSGPIAPVLATAGVANDVRRSWRADRRWTAALVRARQRLRQSAREREWLRLS
jgi:hypothetical protein